MSSETSRCRERLQKFCVGYGGDPIIPSAITVDLSKPYTNVGDAPLNLGGDARDLYWFRDNVLDYVYSSHLLEDFEDTNSVLKEWLRVIKPGGYLILFCPDEQIYREHCKKTGQSYNPSHKIDNFSLNYVKEILLSNFKNVEIIHENPLIDDYSFELVVRKKDTYLSIMADNENFSNDSMKVDTDTNIIDSKKEHVAPYPHKFEWNGSYKKFLMQISQEGVKGKIKKFILKFIGFFAYWQEQINMHIYREIADLKHRIAQIEKGTVENKEQHFKNQYRVTDDLFPPEEKIFVGAGDFKEIGETFLRYFVDLCKLKPDERVLDVGCGIGRIAIPLTKYLDNNGLYEGFDIVADGIIWCRENISARYPNFHFQLADVFNKSYNPHGEHKASNYRFPYENEYFDFVFLISVFTQMLPQDMGNYLREVSWVLKKNGRCFITFFLLNEESRKHINNRNSTLDFRYLFKDKDNEEEYIIDEKTPEAAVAFGEEFIRDLYDRSGLNIMEPIHYGSWSGREKFLSYQDIVIAHKK